MSDSALFVIVDSVNNFDAILKSEKRYLSLRFRLNIQLLSWRPYTFTFTFVVLGIRPRRPFV